MMKRQENTHTFGQRNQLQLSYTINTCQGEQTCPTIGAGFYSICFRVDLADQLVANISRHFRVRKWYVSVFHYLISTTCTNVSVCMRDGKIGQQRKRFKVRDAVFQIVEGLRQIIGAMELSIPKQPASGLHLIRINRSIRKQCVCHLQNKRPTTFCDTCMVYLCLDCFHPFHTTPGYQFDDPEKQTKKKIHRRGKNKIPV